MKIEIEEKRDGETLTLFLKGSLDTSTTPTAETEIKNLLQGAKHLVMDLSGLEYISSAGLRMLLAFHKLMEQNGEMKIKNISPGVKMMFDVSGFGHILYIE